MKIREKILLRARHLEVHVEHRSLGNPPIQDATLPDLTWEEWCYFLNMKWCRDYEQAGDVYDIENYHCERAAFEGDYRIPSVHAFINGVHVPYPTVLPPTFITPIAVSFKSRSLNHHPATQKDLAVVAVGPPLAVKSLCPLVRMKMRLQKMRVSTSSIWSLLGSKGRSSGPLPHANTLF
jgi:hypothetical protein